MAAVLKIRTDSKQSVRAINALTGAWTNANQGVELLGRGLSAVTGLFNSFIEQGSKIENITHAIKGLGPGGKATFEFLNYELGGTVDKMILAQETSRLMTDELGLGLKEISTFYKFAVSKGRQVGLNASEAVRTMTDTLLSGSAGTWERFGIRITGASTQIEVVQAALKKVKIETESMGKSWLISADTMEEQTTKMKNNLTDMLGKFSMFSKGFNTAKSLISFAADSMDKKPAEIWKIITKDMEAGIAQVGKKTLYYTTEINKKRTAINKLKAHWDKEGIDQAGEDKIKALNENIRVLQDNILQEKRAAMKMKSSYDHMVDTMGTKKQKGAYAEHGLSGYDALIKSVKGAQTKTEQYAATLKLLGDSELKRAKELKNIKLETGEMWQNLSIQAAEDRIAGNKETIFQLRKYEKLSREQIEAQKKPQEVIDDELDSLAEYENAQKSLAKAQVRRNILYSRQNLIESIHRDKGVEIAKDLAGMADQQLSKFNKNISQQIKSNDVSRQETGILGENNFIAMSISRFRNDATKVLKDQLLLAQKSNDEAKTKLILQKLEQVANTKTLKQIKKIFSGEKGGKTSSGSDPDPWKQEKQRLKYIKAINAATSDPLVLKVYEKEFNYLEKITQAHWRKRKAIKQNYKIENEIDKIQQKQRDKNKQDVEKALSAQNKITTAEDTAFKLRIVRYNELQTIKKGTGAAFTEDLQSELQTSKAVLMLSKEQGAEYLKEIALKKQIVTINKEASEKAIEAAKKAKELEATKFKNSLLYTKGGSGDLAGLITAEQIKLQDAKNKEDEVGQKRAEKRIQLLQIEANNVAKLKATYPGLFTAANEAQGMMSSINKTALSAFYTENDALKESGDTRKAILKRGVAELLKAKAIEWGVQSLGQLAYGAAMSFINPPKAASHYTSAALFAAAAAAAGVATKKMQSAGWSKSASASGAGAGATSQSPVSGTTENTGSSIIINISESVLGGSADKIAGQLYEMIENGQNRGTIGSWSS